MAHSSGNRNQKLAAKAAKRKAAVAEKQRTERLSASPTARIGAAAMGRVEHCLRTADMFEAGIGHVILARRLPSSMLGCAFFLVDMLCLGAKDAYFREMSDSDLEEHIERVEDSGQALVALDPAAARKLVNGAVAFAARCGIEPAKDYPNVARIFGDVDPDASSETFTFGDNGRPIYIPGPGDSMTRIREVERILDRALGQEGWLLDPPSRHPDLMMLAEALRPEMEPLLADLDEDAIEGVIIDHEGSTEPKPDPHGPEPSTAAESEESAD